MTEKEEIQFKWPPTLTRRFLFTVSSFLFFFSFLIFNTIKTFRWLLSNQTSTRLKFQTNLIVDLYEDMNKTVQCLLIRLNLCVNRPNTCNSSYVEQCFQESVHCKQKILCFSTHQVEMSQNIEEKIFMPWKSLGPRWLKERNSVTTKVRQWLRHHQQSLIKGGTPQLMKTLVYA